MSVNVTTLAAAVGAAETSNRVCTDADGGKKQADRGKRISFDLARKEEEERQA